MKRLLLLTLVLLMACEQQTSDEKENFTTPFENSKGRETATYQEVIDFYKELAREFPEINIQTIGETDSGFPLHMVTFNVEGDFNFQKLGESKTILLINNGIHPGESDGIDATMMLFRDLAQESFSPPENTIVATIPLYNIGGALNRSVKTRVNQNGPVEYGFRGNSRNYDLNRDFLKCDTKNARTFAEIYHLVQPDVFVDNHVSNGADYQYTLSHLFTQYNKLGGELGTFLEDEFTPKLETAMEDSGWPITPYVNIFNIPPDHGFKQFLDHPRYSTGYTSLWNTFGLMIETHMLKPYDQRVEATYQCLKNIVSICESEHEKIKSLREMASSRHQQWTYYPLSWETDSTRFRTLNFKGYQADTLISEITGSSRLKYKRDVPFNKEIPYFNYYTVKDSVRIPEAYIIGKQWKSVIERLDLNGIVYSQLEQDTILEVESYRIKSFDTSTLPYEGHYPHFDTEIERNMVKQAFNEGDYLIPTDQPGFRYLMETMEPQAVDSFFNWNFFDTVLQLKEGFSPYVFEDLALELLNSDKVLKDSFDLYIKNNETLTQNWYQQLYWIYERSEYFESAYNQYPVYRLLKQ